MKIIIQKGGWKKTHQNNLICERSCRCNAVAMEQKKLLRVGDFGWNYMLARVKKQNNTQQQIRNAVNVCAT